MKTTVEIGKTYALRSEAGGEVTDVDGKTLDTLEPNKQLHMTAQESEWLVPDDCKVTKTTFNYALAALGLLGGGADKLPAGYTRLEFLESTGSQYIDTGLHIDNGSAMSVTCSINPDSGVNSGAVFGAQETGTNADRAGWSEYTKGDHGWVFWAWTSEDKVVPTDPAEKHKVELSQAGLYYNGTLLKDLRAAVAFKTSLTCWLFARNRPDVNVEKYHGKIYAFTFAQAGSPRLNLIPALDPTGAPCMFDLVTREPCFNAGSGQFVAGVGTVAQLTTLLRRLPSTGGELTLSLPAEANTPEVAEQLQACHDTKGWTLTVHEYRPAAAATYSLRRVREVVWCRREQSEHGSYVDSTGTRWQVERCAAIFGAQGQDPAAYGYEPFDSEEHAAEQWGLVPYVEPETEEIVD